MTKTNNFLQKQSFQRCATKKTFLKVFQGLQLNIYTVVIF